MKKYFLFFLVSVFAANSFAQTKKKSGAGAATPATTIALNNETDSLSYSIGIMVASFYKQQGISNINDALVNKAIKDKMSGDSTLLTEQQCNQVLMGYIEKAKAAKASEAKKQGEIFLTENKTKPGVITTPSGLQYIVTL